MIRLFFRLDRAIFIVLFTLLTFFFWTSSAHALMLKMDLDELTEGADAIVLGTVRNTSSQWNDDRTSIITTVTVSVEELLKSENEYQEVSIVVPGGAVGGVTQVVSDMPVFSSEERVLLFLSERLEDIAHRGIIKEAFSNTPIFSMQGHFQGKLDVIANKVGGQPLNKMLEQINGLVGKKNYKVEPASSEDDPVFVGSSPYSYNGQKWFDTWPVVEYRINDSGSPGDGCTLTALQNAADTWSNAGAKFSYSYAGPHSRIGSFAYNMVNEITWYDLGSSSTLAQATWWFYSSTGEIFEADMVFNTNHVWSTLPQTPAGAFDVETVALHEFGHWLSLGHSSVYEAVMWPSYKGTQRTLHTDDIAGITYIYGAAATEPILAQYELNIEIAGQGDVDPAEGIHIFEEGTEVVLAATPESGWEFVKWEVNGAEYTTPEINLMMETNTTAKAYFASAIELVEPTIDISTIEELNGTLFFSGICEGISTDFLFNDRQSAVLKVNDLINSADYTNHIFVKVSGQSLVSVWEKRLATDEEILDLLACFKGYWDADGEWVDWP